MLLRPLLLAALLAPACSAPARREAPPAPTNEMAAPTPVATDTGDSRDARVMGRRDAPVTIYEMSDFQCPFCQRHALETLPILEREYIETGKVRYIFINFPITEIHPNALPAAELGLCAARQRKFWPLHDLLFRTQKSWAPLENPENALLGLADSVGMNRQATLACLADTTIAAAVEAEAVASARTGANATPSFYIEGGLLVGAQPIEVFRPILDSIIAERSR
ncbi:MAG TPA: thioredoxin domain-containing protein [Gemmatimonadales bacterium]|nr:thioredoxin domain-containing protein [Gemmatimonadales bacterium]